MSNLLEQASLVMIPSGYKEDIVYSEIPINGSGDLQFTRSSNGTRVNSAGLVEVCPWNLLEQSETIGTSPWNVSGYTLTSNATTAPNGTNTAELFTLNNGNVAGAGYSINQGLPISGAITISVYFKNNNSTGKYVLQTGSAQGSDINVVTLAITNFGTGCIGSVESVGNGWYRFSTFIPSASSPYFFSYQDGMTGDGSKGIYLWGAQINYGALKPYFPTTDRLNVPRLTYQNGGGGCPSLLLEKQSTNLCLWSEQFDNVAWTQNSTSVTANATTSPDGTQNADTITSISASPRVVSPTAVFTSTTNVSIFVKYVSQQWVNLMSGGAVNDYANFDIQNGVIGSVGSTSSNAQIQSFGNGWYRISVTFSGYAGNTNLYFGFIASGTSGWNTFDPNYNKSLYAWGCQIENSSYSTSYIGPTTSSSATRVADACSKTGISSLIGQTSGSVFFDFTVDTISAQTSDPVLWYMKDGGSGERYVELYSNGNLVYVEIDGGGPIATITKSALTIGRHKCAIAYATNDFVFYVDGVQIGTDTSGTPNGFSTFGLQYYLSAYTGSQKVNQCAIFPTRLTNAELASLTTI